MAEDIRKKVFDIVKKETGEDLSVINPKKDFREQTNLDSMQLVAIIARLEQAFKIEIPALVMTVSTLEELLAALENEIKKGGN
ncbi:MAG: acyl carrier protein [Candidatus Aureabacteria bacterium]|nr:acyl carrier protein [Candidatus Auribacterota bacterium]